MSAQRSHTAPRIVPARTVPTSTWRVAAFEQPDAEQRPITPMTPSRLRAEVLSVVTSPSMGRPCDGNRCGGL
jgi:hypothetical protein